MKPSHHADGYDAHSIQNNDAVIACIMNALKWVLAGEGYSLGIGLWHQMEAPSTMTLLSHFSFC